MASPGPAAHVAKPNVSRVGPRLMRDSALNQGPLHESKMQSPGPASYTPFGVEEQKRQETKAVSLIRNDYSRSARTPVISKRHQKYTHVGFDSPGPGNYNTRTEISADMHKTTSFAPHFRISYALPESKASPRPRPRAKTPETPCEEFEEKPAPLMDEPATRAALVDMGLIVQSVPLYIAARDIPHVQEHDKCDPVAVVFVRDPNTGRYEPVGHTEKVHKHEHANWTTTVAVDEYSRVDRMVKICVYDADDNNRVNDHNIMGHCVTPLSALVDTDQPLTFTMLRDGQPVTSSTDPRAKTTITVGRFPLPDQAAAATAAAEAVVASVELSMRASDLPKMDYLSKSDPVAVVSVQDHKTGQWRVLGHTEIIKNNHEPVWKRTVRVDQLYSIDQQLRFALYDSDRPDKVRESDLMGRVDVALSAIVGAQGATELLLKKKGQITKTGAKVFVTGRSSAEAARRESIAEETATASVALAAMAAGAQPLVVGTLEFTMRASHIPKMDTLSKSDPVAVVSVKNPLTGDWEIVGNTETVQNSHEPVWKTKVKVDQWQGIDRTVRFCVYNADSARKVRDSDMVGLADVSVNTILAANGVEMVLFLEKKGKITKTQARVYLQTQVLRPVGARKSVFERRMSEAKAQAAATAEAGAKAQIKAEEDYIADSAVVASIELGIRASRLPRMDILSKSDPVCVVSVQDPKTGRWSIAGNTETIQNNHEPHFKRTVRVDQWSGMDRNLQFSLYDSDSPEKVKEADLMGEAMTPLSKITAADGEFVEMLLYKKGKPTKQNAVVLVQCRRALQ